MGMFKKLRTRIMLLGVALTTLVMLAAFASVYFITAGNLRAEADRKLSDMGRLGFSGYQQDDALSPAYDLSFMLLVDGEGNLLDAHSRCNYPESLEAFEAAARFAWGNRRSDAYKYFNSAWRCQTYEDKDGRYCIAFIEVTNGWSTLGNLLLTLVFVGVGALAAIFALSRFYAGRVIRPVEEAWERQKRFVADASHELKTPLMTIMANCDVLEANEEETVKSQREWLEPIKLGADRMGRLVGRLLTLARTEGMTRREEKRPFDLRGLVGEVVGSMDAAAQTKQLRINVAGMPEREVLGDGDAVRQVFAVLYENAVKYAGEGGVIDVSFRRQRKRAALTVRNTGAGISPEDLPHIFDRFYRASTARSAEDTRLCSHEIPSQSAQQRIWTAARKDEEFFAYRVAMPRHFFSFKKAFSTRWRKR